MAYYANQNLIINDEAAVVHESFPQVVGTIASTEVKITAGIDAASGDNFGTSVAVGCGRIVIGAVFDDDNGSSSGSAYIFDLYGNEITKITASDGAENDRFGVSVAVGSGRIVVGANQPIVGQGPGAAYIFDLDGNEIAKITASDGAIADFFGSSVAVGDGRIVVGAYFDDDNGSSSGSAYIFDLYGNEIAKILASDAVASDQFGERVAVGCGRIIVGARFDDDAGTSSGSAYIFDLYGNQLSKITASDAAASNQFGDHVAVGCGRIVVGAPASGSGFAYIFDLDGNEITKITASDAATGDFFGTAVAIGSGKIIVGASLNDDAGTSSGSAYVFDLDGNELEKITASDAAAGDQFSTNAVSVSNGKIVVGAPFNDDAGTSSGSAYIYSLSEDHNTYWERVLDTYKY